MSVKPCIIGTWNAKDMIHLGAKILHEGGSALDAVETSVNAVEDNPDDPSVGVGGIPNMLGDIELDASIMDGKTRNAGAVASVKHYKNPISIARKVMETTPHVLMVGEGAELFADVMGFKKFDLNTDLSRTLYQAFVKDTLPQVSDSYARWRDSLIDYVKTHDLKKWYAKLIKKQHHGTVNIIALDSKGNICTGVSTSGLGLKLPGRVGDSPIIGAGNYADNRFGGAGCTGRGELCIRLSSARTVVAYMSTGMGVRDACIKAMKDIIDLKETGGVNCVALDKKGNHFSASTRVVPVYYYMNVDSSGPEEKTGVLVQ